MKYQWEVWLTLLLSGSNGMILAKGQVSLIVKADINDALKCFWCAHRISFLIGTMVQITHNLNGAHVSHTCDMHDVGGAKSEW